MQVKPTEGQPEVRLTKDEEKCLVKARLLVKQVLAVRSDLENALSSGDDEPRTVDECLGVIINTLGGAK